MESSSKQVTEETKTQVNSQDTTTQNDSKKTDDDKPKNTKACSTPECTKASTLQCPTCVKMNIVNGSFFCSQECFKAFWPLHKYYHKAPENKFEKFKFTGPLRPGVVSAKNFVPAHIPAPDYATTGVPNEEIQAKKDKHIDEHTPEQIANAREACLLARRALDHGHSKVKPGVTTDEIDRAVHHFIIDNGGYPSPLNYHGFPKSICTSVNEIICHGIPDDRPLEEGDIVNLDISVYYKGMHADLNETFCVGKVDPDSLFLIEQTYRSLEKALEICKPGTMYREVGNVIGKFIESKGLSVVRSYTGHGVGAFFHLAPNVPHYKNNKTPGFMKEGHIFTIEPMINQGTWNDVTWPDEWTAATEDGKRSAQFEHTILITKDGCEVLTKRLPES
eukprot:CAMPEP_0176464300 /NCGR_PEP_ID=MMETSP0127-20121128/36440_1 /TAXON_ID=938130 /ORGANISM="Platyophrya macrostoma, Strain WH" /LENGTH=389 /DNA_ID=CAMNT_0017856701 /DNA_START=40 /DNA_END=1205 /DNA_ORIENTATION=-